MSLITAMQTNLRCNEDDTICIVRTVRDTTNNTFTTECVGGNLFGSRRSSVAMSFQEARLHHQLWVDVATRCMRRMLPEDHVAFGQPWYRFAVNRRRHNAKP